MHKRMNFYLSYYKNLTEKVLSAEELDRETEQLLIQIRFFQHERLIHLIVTVLFALLTVAGIFTTLLADTYQPLLPVLDILFLILLIPYIFHYYVLENGVQKLYTYYDKLVQKQVDP